MTAGPRCWIPTYYARTRLILQVNAVTLARTAEPGNPVHGVL
jgi:hypothetical protein